MTKLCAVATGIDTHILVANARAAMAAGSDMVELRTDHLVDPLGEATTLVDAISGPGPLGSETVVVSVRAARDGGAFQGREEDRHSLLRQLAGSGVAWLDIEGYLPARTMEEIADLARVGGTRVLVSWHVGADDDVERILEEATALRQDDIADAIKLVLPVDGRRDLDGYLSLSSDLAEEDIPCVLLPSGRLSRIGRMLAPVTGSIWVYAEVADTGYTGVLGLPRLDDLGSAWVRMGLRPVPSGSARPSPPLAPEDAAGDWLLLALLGDPVAHTNSPVVHHTAMRTLGMRGAYIPYRTAPGDVPQALDDLASAGAAGCNVTVPLKLEAAASVDSLGDGARISGAVNTVVFTVNGSTRGENTDSDGVRLSAGELLDQDGHGLTALVLGTGGAARGAVAGLVEWGAQVVVTGRSEERLEALCSHMVGHANPVRPARLGSVAGMVDILVQATSQGMRGVPPEGPLTPVKVLSHLAPRAVLDMVYASGGTDLVRAARDLGIPAAGGERVLLHQAVEGFRHWTGRDPPVTEMERALMAVLA